MTDEEKMLREHSNMSAVTFFLDDITKLKVLKRLRSLGIDTKKGSLSATIRVCLQQFAESTDDTIRSKIEAEYIFTTKKNKRSTM